MRPSPWQSLESRLEYHFQHLALLQEALTHKSYGNEVADPGVRDNERLEFLGDAVLGLLVSQLLMDRLPHAREGELSRLRSGVVNETALARVARTLDLGTHLRLGRGEDQGGGRQKDSILADALEALLAALYLDGGLEVARRFVETHFQEVLQEVIRRGGITDFKTALQEFCQNQGLALPRYEVVGTRGPDHQKVFEVALWIEENCLGRGEGRSKKEAEQVAARAALERLQAGELPGKVG